MVDFKKLVTWYMPNWLRKPVTLILLQSFVRPVIALHDAFKRFVSDKLYRLSHNGQVCYLRAVLNDNFDQAQRRIYIDDFEGRDRIFFWPEADRRDVDFSVVQYFWPDSAYADSGVDFTVFVPIGVIKNASELARLNSLIVEYKLPGKHYNIVYT